MQCRPGKRSATRRVRLPIVKKHDATRKIQHFTLPSFHVFPILDQANIYLHPEINVT